MKNLLVSACLLGTDCKYSGGNNAMPADTIEKLKEKYDLVPVCPERDGGLPTPRDPSERLNGRVISCKGRDVTAEFSRGGDMALETAKRFGCKLALLKENSPSCGSGTIYDGTFTGVIVPGYGVTAEKLIAEGITVYGESRADELL